MSVLLELGELESDTETDEAGNTSGASSPEVGKAAPQANTGVYSYALVIARHD